MSERRALLDPEMYKISEEDSQDEEVLNSLRSGGSSSRSRALEAASHSDSNNNTNASRANNCNGRTSESVVTIVNVKPTPPIKPAFLRRPVAVVNSSSASTFSNPSHDDRGGGGDPISSDKQGAVRPQPSHSNLDGRKSSNAHNNNNNNDTSVPDGTSSPPRIVLVERHQHLRSWRGGGSSSGNRIGQCKTRHPITISTSANDYDDATFTTTTDSTTFSTLNRTTAPTTSPPDKWTSSSSSSSSSASVSGPSDDRTSSESDTDNGERQSNGVNQDHHISSSRHHHHQHLKRRKVKSGGGEEKEGDPRWGGSSGGAVGGESTGEQHRFPQEDEVVVCSSCEEEDSHGHGRHGRREGPPSHGRGDEDERYRNSGTGSDDYYDDATDNPHDEDDASRYSYSDSDFDPENDYNCLLDEQVESLVTEAEIESWSRCWSDGNVNVSVREYASGNVKSTGPEISSNGKSRGDGKSSSSGKSQSHFPSSLTPQNEPKEDEVGSTGVPGRVGGGAAGGSRKVKKRKIASLLGSRSKKQDAGKLTEDNGNGPPSSILQNSKPVPVLKSHSGGGGGTGTSSSSAKVFRFKDEHAGEIRNVELLIRSYSRHNLGRRATMVESLLGIVPGKFSTSSSSGSAHYSQHLQGGENTDAMTSKSTKPVGPTQLQKPRGRSECDDRRIMVAGFIPDGAGARNKQIKIGDWLQSVNGIPVDFLNVNGVLLELVRAKPEDFAITPLKVVLGLQRVSGYTVTDAPLKTVTFGESVVRKEGEEGQNKVEKLKDTCGQCFSYHDHHGSNNDELSPENMSKVAVIYISVVHTPPPSSPTPCSAAKEKTKDVIFAWPKESESRKVKQLTVSHGMFSTLYKLLNDIMGSHPVSSRVVIDEEEVMDVVFSSDDEGKGLLLVALSHNKSGRETLMMKKESSGKLQQWRNGKERGDGEAETQTCGLNSSTIISHRLMSRLEALLKFHFGSLSRAFRTVPDEKLDHFFKRSLAGLNHNTEHFASDDFMFHQSSPLCPSLRLPARLESSVDELLYLFEASDSFELCDVKAMSSTPPEKTLFHCLGASLYFKGMQLTSHMEGGLASEFHGWWRTQLGMWGVHHKTLPLSWEPFKRLILWQETFRSQEFEAEVGVEEPSEQKSQSLVQCYSVLLGVGNYMLGMVLEPVGVNQGILKPDVGWIQRGFNCVLRILRSNIHTSVEKCVISQDEVFELCSRASQHGAAVTTMHSSNQFGGHGGSSTSLVPVPTPPSVSSGPSGILKNAQPLSISYAATSSLSNSGSTVVSLSSPSSSSTSSLSVPTGAGNVEEENSHSYHHPPHLPGLNSSSSPVEEHDYCYGTNSNSTKEEEDLEETTTGTGSDTSSVKWFAEEQSQTHGFGIDELKAVSIMKGSVLFDFIQVECGRCVLLTSKDSRPAPFSNIEQNFRRYVTITHDILRKAANGRVRLSQQMNDKKWVSKALTPISEHGVLFTCDAVSTSKDKDTLRKKSRHRQVSYWVVGRIYPNQREVYLCYQDTGATQNLLEIAFKLGYYSM